MELPPKEYMKAVEITEKAQVEKVIKFMLGKQYWFAVQWQRHQKRWQIAFAGSIDPQKEFPRGIEYVEGTP